MTPSNDIRELRGRMEMGMSTARDARVLFDFIAELTWTTVAFGDAPPVVVCRHCALPREKGHAEYCLARSVEWSAPAGSAGQVLLPVYLEPAEAVDLARAAKAAGRRLSELVHERLLGRPA